MICTTYFLTFFSELIPPTGYVLLIFRGLRDEDFVFNNGLLVRYCFF